MMDEQLIDEVAQHGVIYNRQKYYLNGSTNGGKYETKDEAWQLIAMKLRTDGKRSARGVASLARLENPN